MEVSVCSWYLEEVGHLVDTVEHHISAYRAGIYASNIMKMRN